MSTLKKQAETLEEADVPWEDPIWDDIHVAVYEDKYPVTEGHLLFVPLYNTPEVVKDALYDAYRHGTVLMEQGKISGFNIGMNIGPAAGQTVMYPHVHFIPRRDGDVEDPTGGVRGVIPGKAKY